MRQRATKFSVKDINKCSTILLAILLHLRIFDEHLKKLFMRIIRSYLDLLGFSASFLCAVHCLLMPVALSLGLLSGLSWLESAWVEWSFILSTLILASWSLIGSFSKHTNLAPILWAALGFVLIIVLHHAFEHTVGHYFSALGGVLVAYAHYLNWRLLHDDVPAFQLNASEA